MTLIISTEHMGRILTISDLAITGTSATSPVAGRPLDPTPSNPVMGDGVLVAMQQKAVRFDDRRLLLWAGNPIVARRVWTALADAIRHGWDYSIPNLIETLDLTDNAKADIHLIFHEITDRGLIRQIYMCKGAKVDEQETWFMGSGDRHFIDYTVPVFPDQDGSEAVKSIRPWLNRLGSVFLDEALDQSNFQHRYGTWFEIAWYDDGKLKKVPYLIKLWRAVGEEIYSLPTFACWYLDDYLLVRICVVEKAIQNAAFPTPVRPYQGDNPGRIGTKIDRQIMKPLVAILEAYLADAHICPSP